MSGASGCHEQCDHGGVGGGLGRHGGIRRGAARARHQGCGHPGEYINIVTRHLPPPSVTCPVSPAGVHVPAVGLLPTPHLPRLVPHPLLGRGRGIQHVEVRATRDT